MRKEIINELARIFSVSSPEEATSASIKVICDVFSFDGAFLFEILADTQRAALLRQWGGSVAEALPQRRELDSPALRALLHGSDYNDGFSHECALCLAKAFAATSAAPSVVELMDCKLPGRKVGIVFYSFLQNHENVINDSNNSLPPEVSALLGGMVARDILADAAQERQDGERFVKSIADTVVWPQVSGEYVRCSKLEEQKFINELYELITCGKGLEQIITQVMARVCSYFKVQRMRIYNHLDADEESISCKYYYNSDGSDFHLSEVRQGSAHGLLARRRVDEVAYFPDVNNLSPAECAFLKVNGVCGLCSYVLQSITAGGRSVLVMSTSGPMEWTERELNLYKSVCRILNDTLLRADIEHAIAAEKSRTITGVYRDISNAKTSYEMMSRALSSIRKIIGIDRIAVYETPYGEDERNDRAYLGYYDFDFEKRACAPVDWFFISDLSRLDKVLHTDLPLLKIIENSMDKYGDYLPYTNVPSFFAIAPIYSGDKILGAICFSDFSEGRVLSQQDLVNLDLAVHVVESALERKRSEEFIFFRAYYDTLLGIPNRLSAEKYLGALLDIGKNGCMALIDLDDFKSINELAGYTLGDALLREFCRFLQSVITGKGRIFRFGGDEFLIIYEDGDVSAMQVDLDRIIERCRAVWNARGEYHYCTVSIGTIFFPEYGLLAENLLESAAIAMHNAKKHGKNKISNFSISLTEGLRRQYEIEYALRSALENNFSDFHVYFQPIVAANTCKICGCEALLRFYNEKIGRLPADELIAVAERLRIISAIGDYVLHKSFAACRWWRDLGYDFSVNINVSVVQFQHGDLLTGIVKALRNTGCDPRWVVLEITETIAIREVDKILQIVSKLRAMGIRIALDDFGSGYFSFSTMSNIPLDVIKIDQTFTRTIDTDSFSRNFVRSIVSLAHSNGKKVCVEGVETVTQDILVKRMGVDYIQGYLYSKAIPCDELPRLIEDGRADFSSTSLLLPADEDNHYDEMQMLRNQLRISSQQVESFLRSADGFVFEYRPHGRHMRIIYMPAGWKLGGVTHTAFNRHMEMELEAFARQVHHEELHLFWQEFEESRNNPGDLRESIIRIRVSGENFLWTAMRLSTFYDNELRCYRTLAICTNIDAQVRMQKEIEAVNKRFRSLLEATDSFIWESVEKDMGGFRILARPSFWVSDEAHLCNFDCPDEDLKREGYAMSLIHPDDRATLQSIMDKAFATPHKRYESIVRLRVFDYDYRLMMFKMLTYHTADGKLCCLGNSMDVTEALRCGQIGKICLP